MRPKPGKLDRKHPESARDAMDDIKDIASQQNDVRYTNANRDRALGEADRTGRHFDEQAPDEGSAASKEHEAD